MSGLASKVIFWASVVGILISIYLTIDHYAPSLLVCPDSGIISCETVLNSAFATVAGIPVSVGALAWFTVVLFMQKRHIPPLLSNIWLILGIGGMLYSISAMSEIGKICIYCSALDVLIATVLASHVPKSLHKVPK